MSTKTVPTLIKSVNDNKDLILPEVAPALFKIIYAHEASRPKGSIAEIAKVGRSLQFVERILLSPSYRTVPILSQMLECILLANQSVDPNTGVYTHPKQVAKIKASIPKRASKLLWYINHYEGVRCAQKHDDPFPGPHNVQELLEISNLTREEEEEAMSLAEIHELYPIESSAPSAVPTRKSRRVRRPYKECPQCHRKFLAKRASQVFDRKVCRNKYARLHPQQTAPAGMMLEPANAVPEPLIAQKLQTPISHFAPSS
jgi:hypothetical protein